MATQIVYFNINLAYRANLYPIVASIIFLLTNMDNDSCTKRQRDNVQEMLDYRFFEKRMRGFFLKLELTTNIAVLVNDYRDT